MRFKHVSPLNRHVEIEITRLGDIYQSAIHYLGTVHTGPSGFDEKTVAEAAKKRADQITDAPPSNATTPEGDEIVTDSEKKVLEIIYQYAAAVNREFSSLAQRMDIVEATLKTNPALSAAYKKAMSNVPAASIGGMRDQLVALQKAIEQL